MSEKDNRALRNSTFSSSSNPSGNGDNLVAPLTATMSQLSTAAKPTSLSFKIPAQKNAVHSSSTHKSSLSQNLQLHSSKNNNRLHRQRSKSMTLVQQNQDGPSTPTRTSSHSGIGLVKPSPSAFHSTGILSKKSRGVSDLPGNEVKITPETPIKNKRVLGSIWSGMDGPTNAASMLKMTGGVATLMNRNVLNQETPLVKRSTPYNSSKFQNTPPGFSGKPPQIPASLGSSPFDLRFSINNQTTPSVASSSLKTNRLHRSPLKETPSKFAKRPHLDNDDDDGKDINLEGYQENVQPIDLNHAASTNLEQRSKGNTSNISGMDIVIDDSSFVANTKNEDSSMISESPRSFKIQNVAKEPMQPPSAVGQQDQIPPSSSRISSHLNPSPVIPAKLFFSRIVKERKQTSAQHSVSSIPFHALISQYRHPIDKLFFDAIDGIQSALDSTLSLLSKRQNESIPDWFESRFELLGRLGQGEFADAFHVQSIDDGLEYAIKKTRHPFMGHKDALQKLNEVRMLLKVKSSPYCIKLQDAWIQFGYIYIQTELCKRGSLATYFEQYCSETPLSEEQIWRILADIIQGINHIHQQGIVHLDIKPGNIFISQNGTLKIGDFGLASQLPIINSDLEGDRTYLAPECLTNVNVSYPADIFSLGLILLEMAANIILPQNGDIWQQLREGNIEGINLHRHSQMLIDFIQSMLYSDPEQRPSCTDLLKHPTLASFL